MTLAAPAIAGAVLINFYFGTLIFDLCEGQGHCGQGKTQQEGVGQKTPKSRLEKSLSKYTVVAESRRRRGYNRFIL